MAQLTADLLMFRLKEEYVIGDKAIPFYLKNGFKFLKKSEEDGKNETSLLYFNLTSLS